jgi:hypothetical protein
MKVNVAVMKIFLHFNKNKIKCEQKLFVILKILNKLLIR